MYTFEFSTTLSQQDIADIWQNLPPTVNERLETQNAVVEERELIDTLLTRRNDVEWMVFKVKKRALKDFELQRFRQAGGDPGSLDPNI